jgi:Ran GTPase-activating protein (RanGAP) involved in mRNA processing and transport
MLDDWHWSMFRQVLFEGYDDWGRNWVDYTLTQRERIRMLDDEVEEYIHQELDEDKLVSPNHKRWSKALKGLVNEYEFRRGLLERVRTTPLMLDSFADRIFTAAPILDLTLEQCDSDLGEALQRQELAQLTDLHIAGCQVGWQEQGLVGEVLAKATHLTRLRSLWLEICSLGDRGLKRLAASPHLASLRELHLEGNAITSKGILALVASPHLTGLEQLYLNGAWGIGPAGAKRLAAWPGLANVTALDLSSCGIKDAGLAALAASPHLKQLKYLYLHENSITAKGVKALAASRGLPNLRVLELNSNQVQPDGLRALVESNVVDHLNYLGLGDCWLGPDGAELLAGAKRLHSLRALDLSGNWVYGEGLAALFSSTNLRLLAWLDLSANELNPEALELLPKKNALSCLGFLFLNRNNELGDAGVTALANWPGMNNVMTLHLEDTGMGNAGAEALASSPNLDMLTELNVSGMDNSVGRKGKKALWDRFMKELVRV